MKKPTQCPVCEKKSTRKVPKHIGTMAGSTHLNEKCKSCTKLFLTSCNLFDELAKRCNDADLLRHMSLYSLMLLKEKNSFQFKFLLETVKKVKSVNFKLPK